MNVLNQKIFREYDIRGRVDVDFDAESVFRIARCFAERVKKNHGQRIVVGYDGRHSSASFELAVIQGIESKGLNVIRLGLCATPLVYFASKKFNADAAIMITGSHNPADCNGLKFTYFGSPFYGKEIQALREDVLLDQAIFDPTFTSHTALVECVEAYIDHLMKDYTEHYPKSSLKVVWDMGNGATGPFVEMLVKQLGGDHILLNEKVDGSFPAHHPDPLVASNLDQLIAEVGRQNANFGVAFDGDGDRIGVVDEKGQIRWGDQLLMLFAKEALEHTPGCDIIVDVKASQQFFDYVKSLGGNPHLSPSGHSIIKKKMAQMKCLLAGEMSGHIFFGDRNFGYDDAIYAAVRLLGIASMLPMSLGQWFEQFPETFSTPEIRLNCEKIDKFAVVEAVKEKLKQSDEKFNDIDGIRMESGDGWWLLRASNTQEELVVRVEGKTEAALLRLRDDLELILKNQGLTVFEKKIAS